MRAYLANPDRRNEAKIFCTVEELYEWLLDALLSRVGLDHLHRLELTESAKRLHINLRKMSEELAEFNSGKVVAHRLSQARLLQSIKMHTKHAYDLADRAIWDYRKNNINW